MTKIFEKYISHYNTDLRNIPRPQPIDFVINFYNHKEKLFFVDVGAHDGIVWNNTLALEEELSWQGICVEPNPNVFEKLNKNRKCLKYNNALSESEKELNFWKISGYAEMLSGFKDYYDKKHIERIHNEIKQHGGTLQEIKIKSRTLQSLLEENNIKNIDYLSIDTEGAELSILKGINFEKIKIKLLSVENNGYNNDVTSFLKQNKFRYLTKICGDDFFVK